MLSEIDESINEIVVVGGGSKSDLMVQMIADLFGLPVHRLEGSSQACLGATICVCHYFTIYQDFYETIQSLVKKTQTFMLNQQNHKRYNQINDHVVKNIRSHTDVILK